MSHRNEILGLAIEDTPGEADVHFIEERIAAYSIAATNYDDYHPLAVFVRNGEGAIMSSRLSLPPDRRLNEGC